LQLDDLIYPGFLKYTKWSYLQQFPRYLAAIMVRMDKYLLNSKRDRSHEDEINLIYNKWYNHVDELETKHKAVSSELYDFKYKIEELRISLFAQEVRTLYPVSGKRLLTELEQLYLQNLA
jgi:ATP-dependent helicase HrpA